MTSGGRRREGGPLLSTLSLRCSGPSSARSVVAGMSFPKTLCGVIFTISEQLPGLPSDRLGDGYFIPRVLSMLWCNYRAYSFFAKVCFDFSLLPETDIYFIDFSLRPGFTGEESSENTKRTGSHQRDSQDCANCIRNCGEALVRIRYPEICFLINPFLVDGKRFSGPR